MWKVKKKELKKQSTAEKSTVFIGMLLILKMYCGAVLCGLWFASAPSTVCVSVYCGIVFCELGTLFGVLPRRQKSHENLRAKSHECRCCFLAVHSWCDGRALPISWRCTASSVDGAQPRKPTCTTGKNSEGSLAPCCETKTKKNPCLCYALRAFVCVHPSNPVDASIATPWQIPSDSLRLCSTNKKNRKN